MIFIFMYSLVVSASIDQVYKMEQISPGVWDVYCSNLLSASHKSVRSTTKKILANELCTKDEVYSRCVLESQTILPKKESDDDLEVDELISACEKGSKFTYLCIKVASQSLKTKELDERRELIEVIKTCEESSQGVDKCIEFSLERIPSRERDDRLEVLSFTKACSGGTEVTPICLTVAAKGLIKGELDSTSEVIELINACKNAPLEIETCIQESRKRFKNHLLHDQRKELIGIIKKCINSEE